MSLVTRCPTCATTFRVLPAQLSARSGRVRCGKCSAVFDGVASLLTEEAVAALPDEPSPQLGLFELRETSGADAGDEEVAQAPASAPIASVETATPVPVSAPAPEVPKAAPGWTIEGKPVVP